jgi:hypothetical protein
MENAMIGKFTSEGSEGYKNQYKIIKSKFENTDWGISFFNGEGINM